MPRLNFDIRIFLNMRDQFACSCYISFFQDVPPGTTSEWFSVERKSRISFDGKPKQTVKQGEVRLSLKVAGLLTASETHGQHQARRNSSHGVWSSGQPSCPLSRIQMLFRILMEHEHERIASIVSVLSTTRHSSPNMLHFQCILMKFQAVVDPYIPIMFFKQY